uniref:Uncharacterized protein n=1 Tax=Oryza punctata TaxID=4537 RepID=A0A0E0LKY2_ORYPU
MARGKNGLLGKLDLHCSCSLDLNHLRLDPSQLPRSNTIASISTPAASIWTLICRYHLDLPLPPQSPPLSPRSTAVASISIPTTLIHAPRGVPGRGEVELELSATEE